MTSRPTDPLSEPLSPNERELAARLSRLDGAVGPSAALDARILAAARAVASPVVRRRRWPPLVGAAAMLAITVGLAWQLRPAFEFPPPPISQSKDDADEVLAQAEQIPPREQALPAGAVAADKAANGMSSAAPARALSRPAAPPIVASRAPRPGAWQRDHGFEEADHRAMADAQAQPAAASVAAAAPAADRAESSAGASAANRAEASARVAVAKAAPALPPDVSVDARLSRAKWIDRIRARRDAGDIEAARESLRLFAMTNPGVRVPTDLHPLLRPAP